MDLHVLNIYYTKHFKSFIYTYRVKFIISEFSRINSVYIYLLYILIYKFLIATLAYRKKGAADIFLFYMLTTPPRLKLTKFPQLIKKVRERVTS